MQRRFGPGVCGPADASYLTTATETGGLPFFLSPEEVAISSHIMSAGMQSELVLWATGRGERQVTVPVDASIKRVTFSASFDGRGGGLVVMRPDGTPVTAEARIADTVMNCGRVLTIEGPAPGVWQARVTPTSRFWLASRAQSELSLIAVEFVRPGGRPGHEGLFRLSGQPLLGRPATLRVKISEDTTQTEFDLVALDARPIQRVSLRPLGDQEFVGTFGVPDEPFRVSVSGVDGSGHPVRRVHPALFRGSRIEVIPPSVRDALARGSDTAMTFTVRNFGPKVRLDLVAVDTRGAVLPVAPSVIDLDQGADGSATVHLRVPREARPGERVGITFTASSAGEPATRNWAVLDVAVRQD